MAATRAATPDPTAGVGARRHPDHLRWRRGAVEGRVACWGEGGDGQPIVVFLHGWALGQHTYKRALRRLAQRGCRVLAPALPGFGGTADLPGPQRSIPGYAAWVDAFMAATDVGQPALVIGHSFGGGVAIQLAHDFPDRVGQLVLVNSVGGAVAGSAGRSLAERPLWEWGLAFAKEFLPPQRGLQLVDAMREDLVPNLVRNPRALWDVGVLARNADLRPQLAQLRDRHVPVMVVSADADGIIPVPAFDALCSALGIEGTVLHGSHGWLLANPDAFDEVMANVITPVEHTPPDMGDLRRLLEQTTLPAELADELMRTAPALWLSGDAVADLAADLALVHPDLGPGEVRARAAPSDGGWWRFTVVAHDRPGLLADTAGVLTSEGLSILSASVATWDHLDIALHALALPDPMPDEAQLDRIGTRLRSVGEGATISIAYAPRGRAAVRHTGEANGDAMISITAPDQPGLLWAVCRWLADHDASIQAAWAVRGDAGEDDVTRAVFVVRGAPDLDRLERRLSRGEAPLLQRLLHAAVEVPMAFVRAIERLR